MTATPDQLERIRRLSNVTGLDDHRIHQLLHHHEKEPTDTEAQNIIDYLNSQPQLNAPHPTNKPINPLPLEATMKISTAFPSKYLRAADIDDGAAHVHNIHSVTVEEVADGEDHKPILYFDGVEKGLVLNKTNANTVAGLYGDDTERWVGNPVEMFATETEFQGKRVACIRVRQPKARPANAPTAPIKDDLATARAACRSAFVNVAGGDEKAAMETMKSKAAELFPGRTSNTFTAAEWNTLEGSSLPF